MKLLKKVIKKHPFPKWGEFKYNYELLLTEDYIQKTTISSTIYEFEYLHLEEIAYQLNQQGSWLPAIPAPASDDRTRRPEPRGRPERNNGDCGVRSGGAVRQHAFVLLPAS